MIVRHQVPGYVYVNETLKTLLFDELDQFITAKGVGGFLPALNQIGNVATLPGIVNVMHTFQDDLIYVDALS